MFPSSVVGDNLNDLEEQPILFTMAEAIPSNTKLSILQAALIRLTMILSHKPALFALPALLPSVYLSSHFFFSSSQCRESESTSV